MEDLRSISVVAAPVGAFAGVHQQEVGAKVLKHSFPRMNAGASNNFKASTVPSGLLDDAFLTPGLRPGLLSNVPTGLSAESSRGHFSPILFALNKARSWLQ